LDRSRETTIVADSGSEHVDGEVGEFLRDEELTRDWLEWK
jgi:hypothetical protein